MNTVGRMMAIVNWLQQSGASDLIDLDAFLSVELSAFKTPRKTKKLIAVTAEVAADKGRGDSTDMRRKVYCLDGLSEGFRPSISDKEILDLAGKHFSNIKDPELVPSGVRNEHAAMDAAKARIKRMQTKLGLLSSRIERERLTLDHSSDYEIDRFNAMVKEFNQLKAIHNDAIDSYNQSVQSMPRIGYTTHTIISVGGGINLRPKDFAKPIKMPDSPLIKRIRNSQEIVRSSASTKGGMSRSVSRSPDEAMVTKRLPNPWKATGERTAGEITRKQWTKGGKSSMTVVANPTSGYTHYRVATKGYFSDMTVKPGRSEVVVSNSAYPREIVATGNFSPGGTIVLRKGKNIGAQNSQREAE